MITLLDENLSNPISQPFMRDNATTNVLNVVQLSETLDISENIYLLCMRENATTNVLNAVQLSEKPEVLKSISLRCMRENMTKNR